MYRFKIPIGDWSKDGHNQCDYYIIESSEPIEKIISVYIEMDYKYKLSEQCSDYEDNRLSSDFIEELKELGLNPENYVDVDPDEDGEFDYYIEDTSIMAQLIIDMIMAEDSSILLKQVDNIDIPTLNNWTAQHYTKKGGRVLSLPGYGLFN